MHKIISLIATLSILVGMSACTKKVNLDEKVLRLAVGSKIKGMDPIYANDRYSSNEVARIYEGLLEYHYLKRPYTLVPNLAAALPEVSKDGLTYTFKIKPGVFFHEDKAFAGTKRELVAEDFVYSLKRLADPKLQGLGFWVIDGKIKGLNEWRNKNKELPKVDYSEEVEGLKAIDKYTLQFKLSKPFPQFLYSLAMPFTFVVAKEVVETYGKEFINHPVGTGAFILPKFKQSNKIVYTKNPNFRNKLYPSEGSEEFVKLGFLKDAGKQLPFVDKIEVRVMTESQPRWLNFQKGNVDFIAIPKDNFDTAVTPSKGLTDSLAKKGIDLLIAPSLDVTYTAFNHDLKIFKDVRIRRAMNLAFDVHKSNDLFNNGNALPAQSIVPPGIAGNIKGWKSPYREMNLVKAKALLAEAGYENGKGLPVLTYDTSASTVQRQGGEFFKKQMAQIGINIKVITNPWPELQKKITTRQIMLYGIAWGADYPDAENFLQLLYGPNRAPGSNGSGYDNPIFNKLFKKSSVMQDTPERTAIYEKLNRIAAEDVPWIFGVHRQLFKLKHGWLKNFMITDFDQGQASFLNIEMKEKASSIKQL